MGKRSDIPKAKKIFSLCIHIWVKTLHVCSKKFNGCFCVKITVKNDVFYPNIWFVPHNSTLFLVIISAVRISVLKSLISCTACKTFPILPEVEKSSKLLRYAAGSNLSIFTILKIQFCDAFKETLAYQICKFSTFLVMPNSQAASRSFESDKVG